MLGRALADLALLAGTRDDEGNVGGGLKKILLFPLAVLPKAPAMVSPEDYDGVLFQPERFQFLKHTANLSIHETRRGMICANRLALFQIAHTEVWRMRCICTRRRD